MVVIEAVDADRPAALLPSVTADARLPINYLEAKAALARCDNLDEASLARAVADQVGLRRPCRVTAAAPRIPLLCVTRLR
jgi:hypothetical protein